MRKVELLAPAGDLERLKIAILYGADAVYVGGQIFGLRAAAKNFTIEELAEGVEFAHKRGVQIFVTANIIPHNEDLHELPDYLKQLYSIGVDAIIVSDPGTFSMVREAVPEMEIHISTQANNVNYKTFQFWHQLGAKRVVLARELSVNEIKEIRDNIPSDLDLEGFVHGAMCISYSGRCLLSNYMANRDANKGECAQPCRWKYALVEEKRPGEYMPVYEDERGTYFMNAKDLCMIHHVDKVIQAGVYSLKIEGRMKTTYYVATVVRAYRKAIDSYLKNPENWTCPPELYEELQKASHREFTTGFYFDKPGKDEHLYTEHSYVRNYEFIGMVLEGDKGDGITVVEQRNRFYKGDKIEILTPREEIIHTTIEDMWDEDGNSIEVAPHPKQIVKMKINCEVEPYDLLRKERVE
ncbi:peptidase U32 family protein [Alkaliphilus peptidifermentans]|uniref:Putative protease n=1 Tax=Alkaliphilus peptidifermentans DSM 18978 TaxID=1120976 RepID=A0A1G5KCE8_9FIRM|nr:U32 family peptidase [Alkaliphilus peptidifermentans]SCY98302.1 putative protease [Alkaliphilus peptidifermentans DSM 18978]